MRPPLRAAAALALTALLATGCSSHDTWSTARPTPTPRGTPGAGFVDSASTPAPESTVTPAPGSWNGVHPPGDYHVVLLTAGTDPTTKSLVRAVEDWADAEGARLRTVRADGPSDLLPSITRAVDLRPDLVISAGNDLIDPLATVSANHLSQQFLVVGAELAEPTGNVTAADWSGASFRGEGLAMSSAYDPGSFTSRRCTAAVRAGTTAVLRGRTGIVLWLDDV